MNKVLSIGAAPLKEYFTDEERELFTADVREVCSEYFEGGNNYTLDVTRTPKGFSVCLIFDAARIKNFKRPK